VATALASFVAGEAASMWIARLRTLPKGRGATLGCGSVESTNYDYAVQALMGLLSSVRDEEENLADAVLSDGRRLQRSMISALFTRPTPTGVGTLHARWSKLQHLAPLPRRLTLQLEAM
jgi:hypothetical protein